jgi:hypothetical protein
MDAVSKNTVELSNLISRFLDRDVKTRLGVKETGGMATLKAHPFFKKLDWDVVGAKKAIPPFIPDVIRLLIIVEKSKF